MTRVWTTHLRNLVTAEVSRAVNNGEMAHVAAERIEIVVVAHERHCLDCADTPAEEPA